MARASKAKDSQTLSDSLREATATATGRVLRLVAEAKDGPDSTGTVKTIAELTQLCEQAADHMSKAHQKLFDGEEGGDAAIEHLDAALKCLKKVEVDGARRNTRTKKAPKKQRRAKSA
ncbi:MAG: hypothetical protein MPJ78_07095 [Hyphomicrobiaceae bacterium]|nr:hypothetical protein [Hyphomicrobiaceae bacterium]